MGKLVKYCSGCEEGFAERFGFCPNCGGQLEAFEMNPVAKIAENVPKPETVNSAQTEVPAKMTETIAAVPEMVDFSKDDDILELDTIDESPQTIEKTPEILTVTSPAIEANGNGFHYENQTQTSNFSKTNDDDGYHVTVVSQEASSWYKPFVASLLMLAFLGSIAAYVIAIWIHGYNIPEIAGVNTVIYSALTEDEPTQIEEEVKKKDKREGGGGGGGGKNNPDPVSRGRVPNQSENPSVLMPVPVMPNPSIPIPNTTQGKNQRQQTDEPIGNPNSLSTRPSSGSGSGDGMGTGSGSGYGSGRGTGEGSGIGSGSGGGRGNGNGDGDGDGDLQVRPRTQNKPETVANSGVTKDVTITSKPQPRYTDAARQNNVQGSVTLRVTFNADGTIGAVSPVNSLPNGLTEQAIAAAKQIKFQPAMRNGQPIAKVKQVVYSFTIY